MWPVFGSKLERIRSCRITLQWFMSRNNLGNFIPKRISVSESQQCFLLLIPSPWRMRGRICFLGQIMLKHIIFVICATKKNCFFFFFVLPFPFKFGENRTWKKKLPSKSSSSLKSMSSSSSSSDPSAICAAPFCGEHWTSGNSESYNFHMRVGNLQKFHTLLGLHNPMLPFYFGKGMWNRISVRIPPNFVDINSINSQKKNNGVVPQQLFHFQTTVSLLASFPWLLQVPSLALTWKLVNCFLVNLLWQSWNYFHLKGMITI